MPPAEAQRNGCPTKLRLINELKAATKELQSIYDEEFVAISQPNFSQRLAEVRENRAFLLDTLKIHMSQHGC